MRCGGGAIRSTDTGRTDPKERRVGPVVTLPTYQGHVVEKERTETGLSMWDGRRLRERQADQGLNDRIERTRSPPGGSRSGGHLTEKKQIIHHFGGRGALLLKALKNVQGKSLQSKGTVLVSIPRRREQTDVVRLEAHLS